MNQFLRARATEADVIRGFVTSPEYLFRPSCGRFAGEGAEHGSAGRRRVLGPAADWSNRLASLDTRRAAVPPQTVAPPETTRGNWPLLSTRSRCAVRPARFRRLRTANAGWLLPHDREPCRHGGRTAWVSGPARQCRPPVPLGTLAEMISRRRSFARTRLTVVISYRENRGGAGRPVQTRWQPGSTSLFRHRETVPRSVYVRGQSEARTVNKKGVLRLSAVSESDTIENTLSRTRRHSPSVPGLPGMKAFDYSAPTTVAEAVALLADKGDKARALAGGTDVIVQVREGRRDLDLLVDINTSRTQRTGLRLGARPALRRRRPVLPPVRTPWDSAGVSGPDRRGVAHRRHADSEPGQRRRQPVQLVASRGQHPALIAAGAICIIAGPERTARMPVEAFCTGAGSDRPAARRNCL